MRDQLKHLAVNWVLQKEQLGSGHAVQQVLPDIADGTKVLILFCDVPMISEGILQTLISSMPAHGMAILTAELKNPTGFGRIIRDQHQQVLAIVEQKDADEEQRKIREINSGIMAIDAESLKHYLPEIKAENSQKEYYLTDIVALMVQDKKQVVGIKVSNSEEVLGINDKQQLAHAERYYQSRLIADLLRDGLTLRDPARFDLRGKLIFASDVSIDVNVVIEGEVKIGENSTVGANNYLRDVVIGNNVQIKPNCVIEGAIIEDNCVIGPFARIRPQSLLKEKAHVGNFVEIKNSEIGSASKANHLSYVGDAKIGSEVNIGAGTITCNYDGANKRQTIIDDDAFIGSNVSLVAPVKIGKNATIGAGSVITQDAPENKLTLGRARQITLENWQRSKKLTKKEAEK